MFKFIIFFISLNIILVQSFITIRPNDISIGELNSEPNYQSVRSILKEFFKLSDESLVQFWRVENQNETADSQLITLDMHPFMGSIHLAYSDHLPLILTPDIIWHLIASGTSQYINQNSEEVRKVFVDFEGRKEITVRNDALRYNSSLNKWDEIIDELSSKIKKSVKWDVFSLFNSNFSTTNRESNIVSKIVLMESMQNYFEYGVVTACGIPEIRIMGEKNDWVEIKNKMHLLNQKLSGLSVWYNQLSSIIQHFIDVYDNKVDNSFWNEIYKSDGGSGGPYVSGWAISFFPYFRGNYKNKYVWDLKWQDAAEYFIFGLTTSNFVPTINAVPFKWSYYNKELEMKFAGGLLGIHYNKTDKSIKPVFGYSIIG